MVPRCFSGNENSPASASQVLQLQVCVTIPQDFSVGSPESLECSLIPYQVSYLVMIFQKSILCSLP